MWLCDECNIKDGNEMTVEDKGVGWLICQRIKLDTPWKTWSVTKSNDNHNQISPMLRRQEKLLNVAAVG